jgi:hypothetical protein
MLVAPMTGGNEMAITFLRKAGELVQPGDVIAQFDTTEQEFQLREAEADLAEAEQQVVRAQAESSAKEEENRHMLLQAKAEVRQFELEARRNPLVPPIKARENTLALEGARERLHQLEEDLASRKATTEAGVAIQEAARNKAKVKAETAQRNIDAMTLKAKSEGYVAIQPNMNGPNSFGAFMPMLQVGDTVRAGMAIAQIPDLKSWEVVARISELDRGHLSEKQPAMVEIIALPGKTLMGYIKLIGGTTGPNWDRRFECRIALNEPSPELRPGMTARLVITTQTIKEVLWVPSQAVFDSDGRTFIYARTDQGFVPKDVKIVRRSESRAVVEGLTEGQTIALAAPDQALEKQKDAPRGAAEALQKK